MSLTQKLVGYVTGNGAEVDASNQLKVALPKVEADVGMANMMSMNDDGTYTGLPILFSPETDSDYRIRTSDDVMLDDELFNYTAQNTGKHTILGAAVNLVPSWTAGGYNTNPTGVLTATSGATLQTYAFFSQTSTATLSLDTELAFTAQPQSNTIVDWGFFLGSTSNPFAPTDGVYFRLNSAGLQGIINYNGAETSTGVFPATNGTGTWTYANNTRYQFILYIANKYVQFWVSDGTTTYALGTLAVPAGQGSPMMSTALPFRIRHAIAGGAAGAALNCVLSRYSVRLGGVSQTENLARLSSRALGTYQGLSGGTLGSLQFGTVTTGTVVPPTAAVPTNTTAALGSGLGGLFYETVSLATATDGILMSYQVPAGTVNVQGRRLKITGIGLSSFVQTVVVGGPYVASFYLAFGHTAVSLQTAESSTTKAARRMRLPFLQLVTAAQAVSTLVAQSTYTYSLDNPVYVNPGEFIQLVTQHTGTAGTTGTVAHVISLDYSWE